MKFGVFIGRFQPLHIGHVAVITEALKQVDRLIVFFGSANQVASIRNPFSYRQRADMLTEILKANPNKGKLIHAPLNDFKYNDAAWISQVKANVNTIVDMFGNQDDSIVLFGNTKPDTDYLKWFPGWSYKEINTPFTISATDIREKMFETRDPSVAHVQADWDFYTMERSKFKNYPYPETLNFNCADAVVTCLGHVLLIKRKFAPGAGCWALPGGFKNRNETFKQCAIRELFEETNIRVPQKVVEGSIKATKLYDAPDRSFGIPRNTLAVHIDLAPDADGKLPRANGADDAAECKWVDIMEAVKEMPLYDDHRDILEDLLGIAFY